MTDDGGNPVTSLLPCDGEYLEVLSSTYGYYFLVLDQYTSRCTKICLSKQFALTKKGLARGRVAVAVVPPVTDLSMG